MNGALYQRQELPPRHNCSRLGGSFYSFIYGLPEDYSFKVYLIRVARRYSRPICRG